PDEGVAVQRDPSACFVSELGQQRRRVVDLRNHFQTGLTVGVERGLGMHRFLVGRGVTTAYDRGGRTAFGTYLLVGVIDATPAAAARAGCDREADGRVPGWEGCARANRGTTDVVRSVVARRVTVPCAATPARVGVRRRASTCGRPCPRQRWEVQDEPPRRDRAGGRVGNIRAGRATDGPPEWRRRRSSTGSSPMPPTHRYRFAGCRTRRTDAREASARFWRGRAFSPAGPYDLTAGAQEGPGAQVTHEVMGAVHRPGQAGPPPHDRGAGAAGPLLLAVPTDSATSAAPRPCA